MVFSILVISLFFWFAAVVFFGLFIDAYLHIPAKLKARVRSESRKGH